MQLSRTALIVLVVLTCQNTSVPIMMRLAQTGTNSKDYCVPMLVVMQETMKLVAAFLLLGYEAGSITQAIGDLKTEVFEKPIVTLKLAVPALLYFVMNSAVQLANGYLPSSVFHLTYQGKILVVAMMSVVLLGKRLEVFRWCSIAALALGLAVVQIAKAPDQASKDMAPGGMVIGLGWAVLAAGCSGLAGVYFEMMLKKPTQTTGTKSKQPSIWLRNIQLALFSILIGLPGVYLSPSFDAANPLRGFDWVVWALGFNNALGGLIVALVIKYADNLLKCFSNAISTVLGTIIAIFVFGFEPSMTFVVGAAIVLASVLAYGGIFTLPPFCHTVLCAELADSGAENMEGQNASNGDVAMEKLTNKNENGHSKENPV